MLWRMTRSEHDKKKGAENKNAMKRLVRSGVPTGILAYRGEKAIGWCAVAPRQDYPALERSRVLKPIDEQSVWSVACLYIDKSNRGKGVSVEILRAAIRHVKKSGGEILEGYPVEPRKSEIPDVFAWTGIASAFISAGFAERGRGSETRPIMRYEISAKAKRHAGPHDKARNSDA